MAAVEVEEWCSRKKEAWLSSVELDVVGGGKEELSTLGRGKHLGSCSGSHLLLERKTCKEEMSLSRKQIVEVIVKVGVGEKGGCFWEEGSGKASTFYSRGRAR